MLEHFFTRTSVVAQLRSGPLGPYLDDLATHLHQQGYAPSSIQSYLRAGNSFGRWLHAQGYAVNEMDDAVFQRYVAGLNRYRSGHLPKAAEGLKPSPPVPPATRGSVPAARCDPSHAS
jgi:hypothetical protein